MELIDELDARGLVANVTDRDALAALLREAAPVAAYAGYDPTSPSLHLGNLVPTILLKRLQLAGHRPIVVVGGATGMIGDPSGKSAERNLLDDATLATNLAGIRAQLARLLDFDDPKIGAVMTNNADWTRGVGYLEFLRDIGKHLTINYMMAKESVRTRLEGESGISYTEFSYMLLQAFDFVQLSKSHGCRLQVGGNDQYGNITAGCELQHKLGGPRLFGLAAPLLLDASGQKMGKTATGEKIWLRAMTAWVHGDAAARDAEAAGEAIFDPTRALESREALERLEHAVPTLDLSRTELDAGVPVVDLFARAFDKSKSTARKLVTQGGAYVNDVRVRIEDVHRKIATHDLAHDAYLVLRIGKRDYRLVRVK